MNLFYLKIFSNKKRSRLDANPLALVLLAEFAISFPFCLIYFSNTYKNGKRVFKKLKIRYLSQS